MLILYEPAFNNSLVYPDELLWLICDAALAQKLVSEISEITSEELTYNIAWYISPIKFWLLVIFIFGKV